MPSIMLNICNEEHEIIEDRAISVLQVVSSTKLRDNRTEVECTNGKTYIVSTSKLDEISEAFCGCSFNREDDSDRG
jgi:hypothetical protein